jgi:hypothetical protein
VTARRALCRSSMACSARLTATETPCVNVFGIGRAADGRKWKAPPMSAVSPVRSLLVTRSPEDLRRDRAAPARHRALAPPGCSRGWMAVCPATPQIGPAGRPASAPRQPIVAVDCADRRPDAIGSPLAASPAHLRQLPCTAPCRPQIARPGSQRDRRGGRSWHPGLISRDASRVQWIGGAAILRSCKARGNKKPPLQPNRGMVWLR